MPKEEIKLSEESENLYKVMLDAATNSDEGLKKLFFQPDLKDLADESAKTVEQLLRLVQELINHCLVRTSRMGGPQGPLCWSTRPRVAAKNIRSLAQNEKVLYEYVEDSHTKGIWLRDLKKRSGIEDKKVEKAMQKLESARLVKLVKNIRAPAQKTYMLAHLVPSDDVTGGSFFDAGDLDETLIQEVGNLIVFHVRTESWVESKDRAKHSKRRRTPEVISDDEAEAPTTNGAGHSPQQRKRKRHETPDIEDAIPARKSRQLAYQPGNHAYPTLNDIHTFITTTSAIRQSKAQHFTLPEIQGVIDLLVWDDKLERVGSDGYRTIKGVQFRTHGYDDSDDDDDELGITRKGNGFTQAPCGKCPVFDLCGTGGPINAGNCKYYETWLGEDRVQ